MNKPTKVRPLTRKQKAFADMLINNPKMSATQVALNTYGKAEKPPTPRSATQIAMDNLAKPSVQLYLDEHIQKAKSRIVQLIDSDKEEIALRASDSVLDRALGKAKQVTEVQTTGVTLTIDLTSSLSENTQE